MNIILIRVGMDCTQIQHARRLGEDQTASCRGWNAPVSPNEWEFAYVPILESHKTKRVRPGYEIGYEQFKRPCEKLGVSLPQRFEGMCSHLDPDFEHLTYGDEGKKATQLRRLNLGQGDTLAFYAALSARHSGWPDLVYGLIGLYVLARGPVRAQDIPQELWPNNAHTRRCFEDDDIVFIGKEGESGRFRRCIRIGERRGKGNQYRLTEDLRDKWGGLWVVNESGKKVQVKDAWIQRSGRLPCIGNPEAFSEWFSTQMKTNELIPTNNPD